MTRWSVAGPPVMRIWIFGRLSGGTQWDGNELLNKASPELHAMLGDGVLEQIMSTASFQLGSLKEYQTVPCILANYEITAENGELALAQCVGPLSFEKTDATIKLNLVFRQDSWRILGFFIAPETVQDRPVTVSYTNETLARTYGLSLDGLSAGFETDIAPEVGIEFGKRSKIENR